MSETPGGQPKIRQLRVLILAAIVLAVAGGIAGVLIQRQREARRAECRRLADLRNLGVGFLENLKLKQANLAPQPPKPRQLDFTRIEQPAAQPTTQPTFHPSAEPASNSLPLSLADLDLLEKMLDEAMKNSESLRNNSQNPSVIPQISPKISSPAEQSAYESVLQLLQSYEQASA